MRRRSSCEQLVEGLHRPPARSAAAAAAASSGSNGSPATAAPSSTSRASSDSSASSSARAAATVAGTPIAGQRRLVADGAVAARRATGELLEIEGVAAALVVEDVRVDAVAQVAEQLSSLLGAERAELDARDLRRRAWPARAPRTAAPAPGAGGIASASSTGAAGGRRSSAPSSSIDAGVGPVEVVEHEHERLRRRELLEQRTHRAVAAIALVLERRRTAAGECRQRREDVSELRPDVVVQSVRRAPGRALARTRRARRRRARTAGRARARRPSRRGPDALGVGAGAELGQQPRLADARLTDEQNRDRAPPIELGQGSIQRAELLRTPDQVVGLRATSSSRGG